MTQAPAERRHTERPHAESRRADGPQTGPRHPGERLTDDETWRLSTAAAAALDHLDRITPAEQEYDRHIGLLDEIETQARAGRLPADELPARRAAVLYHLRECLQSVPPGPHVSRLARLWGDGPWLPGLYLPALSGSGVAQRPSHDAASGAAQRPSHDAASGRPTSDATPVPSEHRFAMHWQGPDLPGLAQLKVASTETGRLHVLNATLPIAGAVAGDAQAGVGIMVRPSHPVSRITFRAEATYRFRHLIETPRVRSYVPWSTATSRGRVRLVVQRIDAATGGAETYLQRGIPLWDETVGGGAQRTQDSGGGSYPGPDPGLQFVGAAGDLFACWFVASVGCAKNDQDPTGFTVCRANLDCEVAAMWVDELPLT